MMTPEAPDQAARLAAAIEHTLLRPEAQPADIDRLCDEAVACRFHGVCVNPAYVAQAARRLEDEPIRVITVVGFPLGANATATKVAEARRAMEDGAFELDMVINLGRFLAGDGAAVRAEIEALAGVVHGGRRGGALKVILETAALTPPQMIAGCRLCAEGEADFVKTSTGFHAAGGASVAAVQLLHRHASPLGVKAAGGIRTAAAALAMLDAGASRIGTSAGVDILQQLRR